MSLRNSSDDVRKLSATPLRLLIHKPPTNVDNTKEPIPKLDIKNMFNKISPKRLINKLSPTRSLNNSPNRSLNNSPTRQLIDVESPESVSSSSLSSSSSGLATSISSGSSVSKMPFMKRPTNYLSRSASNVNEEHYLSKDYRRSRRDTYDEDHCYTCDVKIPTQDGILLALKCTCSEIKSFHNGYCRRIHWIYSQTCKMIHNDIDKVVTLEDVFNQEHLYDSAESED